MGMAEARKLPDGRTVYRVRVGGVLVTTQPQAEAWPREKLAAWCREVGAGHLRPLAQAAHREPGDPALYDAEAGAERYTERMAAATAWQAATDERWKAAKKFLRGKLRVTYAFREFGLGGAEVAMLRLAKHLPGEVGLAVYADLWRPDMREAADAAGLTVAKDLDGADVVLWNLSTRWDDPSQLPPRKAAEYAAVARKLNVRHWLPEPGIKRALDGVLAVSATAAETVAEVLDGVPIACVPEPIAVTPQPAAKQREKDRAALGIPAGAVVAYWSGRLHAWEKNLPLLRDCIAATNGPLYWLVVGYFAEGHESEAAAWVDFTDDRYVTWVDNAGPSEAQRLATLADISVSTSHSEGLCIALADGMAAGCPAVATDSGGVRDLVITGATGTLVEQGDRDGLIAALLEMAGEDGVRARMGEQAKALIEAAYQPEAVGKAFAASCVDAIVRRSVVAQVEHRALKPGAVIAKPKGADNA